MKIITGVDVLDEEILENKIIPPTIPIVARSQNVRGAKEQLI